MSVHEDNACLIKSVTIGTFLLNHTRAFQGNIKMKSVKIPTKNLIEPRQIVFESYGHLFTGVFKSAPTSNGNKTMLH